jgi:hypothetical protein
VLQAWQWTWRPPYSQARDDDGRPVERLVGTAASGLDLAVGLAFRLHEATAGTAGQYHFQTAAWYDLALRPGNQDVLALLEAWMAEPDDLGEDWWEEFDRSLHHRPSFRDAL